jgi:glutathione S-transferase
MRTLFSYPDLFGVADNNPFGLKVYAFMRLCGMEFEHRHILAASQAPRGQLPYLADGDRIIGDSDTIIAYLKHQYDLDIDTGLTPDQSNLDLLVRRTLDDLYWVMSYSRWQDERFYPSFSEAIIHTHPEIKASDLDAAREYNRLRYHYQGIGRYEPDQVYARGVDDLRVVGNVIGDDTFAFGSRPTSIDAAIYGFVANIYFYDIDTPLKQYVLSQPRLVRHCEAMHARIAQR